ncbi:hypothetical protein L210DRAFT_3416331 [Boletus edulis BED1]|uniref:Uncharacterized protein n=1 Tax=Boletus edulis BED1 TaxID=1328754 RepID=A0AAD4G9E9_BOLED|nr:hypothetical protein L210DRAFT_3416331 [Boletus edulis BED1]
MGASSQDVYAKYLQHADYGYPLRMPEPMSTLPEDYRKSGLQIGDVGVVDSNGQFDVLFNIWKHSNNPLHRHGVPKNFQPVPCEDVKSSPNAISAGPIHSYGINQILEPAGDKSRSADYEFESSAPAGAILILPHGAMSAELSSLEQFRQVAIQNAIDWYELAKKRYGVEHLDRSLYLITGFYKSRYWSLASFKNPKNDTGKIQARKHESNPNIYPLQLTFPSDRRHSHSGDDSGNINQTVFIRGFKITFSRWLPHPVVLTATEVETTWSKLVRLFNACLSRLRNVSGGHKPPVATSKL